MSAILAGRDHVRSSTNEYDWLGPGAYFWENSPQRALEWAKSLKARPKSAGGVKHPFAIGAIINPGLCLDLTEASDLAVFRESYDELAKTFAQLERSLPRNESAYRGDEDLVKRRLDCLVATFLHGLREKRKLAPFDTLRAAFFEGPALYEGTKITAKTHLQWCVRNPAYSILGYFRPLPTTATLSAGDKGIGAPRQTSGRRKPTGRLARQ